MDAWGYLRGEIERYIRERGKTGSPHLSVRVHELRGAARALVHAGMLSASDLPRVMEEFWQRCDAVGAVEQRSISAIQSSSFKATRGEPKAVLSLDQTMGRVGERQIEALALIILEGKIIFQYSSLGGRRKEDIESWHQNIRWSLFDDSGHSYPCIDSYTGTGSHAQIVGEVAFDGTISSGATTVVVRAESRRNAESVSAVIDLPDYENGEP